MSSIQNVQSQIDNIKEKLTSKEYKNLCDSLMKVNNKKQTDMNLYVIRYLRPHMNKGTFYNIVFSCDKKIIQLTELHYEKLKAEIENCGFCTINFCSHATKNWEHRDVMFTMYKNVRPPHSEQNDSDDESDETIQVSNDVLVEQVIIGITPLE